MRKFKEADILASDPKLSKSHQVLLHVPLKGKQELRAAPQYIDNPFSQNFHDGFTKPHLINLADQFCVEVPDAVLYGERAVVTREDILLTDYRSSPPTQPSKGPNSSSFPKRSSGATPRGTISA